ncbi:polysaccharide pyruvyl transferase family protein [Vibrio owensii]|uniref:polysaccharide pyruvyl transferase family protein n=1 Tax=Vibrio owensii TaxID=696485 RepID=UPI0033940A9D
MKKIKLVGYLGDLNLGDQVLFECAEFLIDSNANGRIEISKLDLKNIGELTFFEKIKRKFGLEDEPNELIKKKVRDYKLSEFDNVDAIIFAGGGMIKYHPQDCWKHVAIIISIAQELDIPVYLNSVGVEGYDKNDKRCQVLKNALNKTAVKRISTRDDLALLRDNYVGDKVLTERVCDSAVHCSAVYDVTQSDSEVIGIGLVRGNIFLDHGKDFNREKVISMYSEIILQLESEGKKYELFTNGLPYDTELIQDLRKATGRALTVTEPSTPKELITIIAGYKGVIAARLHACIISYSLAIPVVGLVWNDKLAMFGEHIGYSNRFMCPNRVSPKQITDALDGAIQIGYNESKKKEYARTVENSLKEVVEEILNSRV